MTGWDKSCSQARKSCRKVCVTKSTKLHHLLAFFGCLSQPLAERHCCSYRRVAVLLQVGYPGNHCQVLHQPDGPSQLDKPSQCSKSEPQPCNVKRGVPMGAL